MSILSDLTGMKFGRLAVISRAGATKDHRAVWLCLCDCGNQKKVSGKSLRNGDSRSCGCLSRESRAKRRLIDLSGNTYGRLAVIKRVPNKGKSTRWLCKCICGGEVVVLGDNLKSGHTKSCGCIASESKSRRSTTHGPARPGKLSKLFVAWQGMKARCYNDKSSSYRNYGGRGIKVCDRWLNSFENFLEDVGDAPSVNHSIDRIDPNGNYETGNVRWATRAQQNNNKRGVIKICFYGTTKTISEWSKCLGIPHGTLYSRYRQGMTPFQILVAARS